MLNAIPEGAGFSTRKSSNALSRDTGIVTSDIAALRGVLAMKESTILRLVTTINKKDEEISRCRDLCDAERKRNAAMFSELRSAKREILEMRAEFEARFSKHSESETNMMMKHTALHNQYTEVKAQLDAMSKAAERTSKSHALSVQCAVDEAYARGQADAAKVYETRLAASSLSESLAKDFGSLNDAQNRAWNTRGLRSGRFESMALSSWTTVIRRICASDSTSTLSTEVSYTPKPCAQSRPSDSSETQHLQGPCQSNSLAEIRVKCAGCSLSSQVKAGIRSKLMVLVPCGHVICSLCFTKRSEADRYLNGFICSECPTPAPTIAAHKLRLCFQLPQ